MGVSKNFTFLVSIYIIITIALFLILTLAETIKNNLIISLISSLFLVTFLYFLKEKTQGLFPEKGLLRYSMLCKDCGWEWMSNVSKNGNSPRKCPHCHQAHLEITGWRTVKQTKKRETDLRKFFK